MVTHPDVLVSAVSFLSLGGVRIGAYITRPRESRGGLVVGHGYGGLSTPILRHHVTVIAPCIRGFGLSMGTGIPWCSDQHVLQGRSLHQHLPVVCTPTLFDPVVVPPGQFAVHNSIPRHVRQTFILEARHWSFAGDEPTLRAAAAATDTLFLGNASGEAPEVHN